MKSRHYSIDLAARSESDNETATILCAIRRLRSSTALGALWFALVFVLLPSSLEAECAQWDVSGTWGLKQNDGIRVHMGLSQEQGGTHVSGTAWYRDGKHVGDQRGEVKGTVQNNKFDLRVVWKTGNVGNWNGTIQPSGVIKGRCSDEKVRSYQAIFVSDGPMTCLPST